MTDSNSYSKETISKKRKASSLKNVKTSKPLNTLNEIKSLETKICSSNKNLSLLSDLISICESLDYSSDNFINSEISLLNVFIHLYKNGLLRKKRNVAINMEKLINWNILKYNQFINILTNSLLLNDNNDALFNASVTIFSHLIKTESIYNAPNKGEYYFPKVLFKNFFDALFLNNASELAVNVFLNFIKQYDDLRYYFYLQVAQTAKELHKILQNKSNSSKDLSKYTKATSLLISSLLYVPFPNSSNDFSNFYCPNVPDSKTSNISISLRHNSSHKRAFQDAWISTLQLPLTLVQFKNILRVAHQQIIPFLPNPEYLMDFLTDAYNAGGSISLLALNALFVLIHKYNLDYPHFYTKLYALLDGDLLYMKYRSRFFRLLDLFLSSTHLPATLVASFIKRLCRLSLTAPPPGIVITLPMVYNLIKLHPTCSLLIHRIQDTPKDDPMFIDTFDPNEKDPNKTGAIDSSLWELESLMNHYHPNVSTLAKIFTGDFRKPSYALDDFLDYSYTLLLDSEAERKPKNATAIEYEKFDKVFGDTSQGGYIDWCL